MPEATFFETESRRSRADVTDYLRPVADDLDGDGTFTLRAGEQSTSLAVFDRPTFEVKAERAYPGGLGEPVVGFDIKWPEDGGEDGSLSGK